MKKTSDLDFEISFYEKVIREKPDYIDALIPLAEAYTKKGRYQEGLEIDKRLVKLRRSDPMIHYNLACSLALVGDSEDALLMLRRAIALGYRDLDHLRRDPDLKNLYGHPDFQELIKNFPKGKSSAFA